MSATEVIEQIKALPAEEKKAVVEFLHRMEASASQPAEPLHAEVEATAAKVFDRYDPLFRKLAQ